ncbi:protein of unknown function [Shewanella benthica]|uniref:Uncharacterized protein n=1 Tax=Shewanella benthica TaxID=43661 RepID=A0A330M0F4_9GAMM|nr:protein of unknown function [Shewanella benthica]
MKTDSTNALLRSSVNFNKLSFSKIHYLSIKMLQMKLNNQQIVCDNTNLEN